MAKTEKIERIPILIVPLTKKEEYPRLEVYSTPNCAVMGVKMDEASPLTKESYCTCKPDVIIRQVDRVLFVEKTIKNIPKSYKATLAEFLSLCKEHDEFIRSLTVYDE